MSRNEQERLRDIKDAISTIYDHLAGVNETSAAKEDPLLHDALLFWPTWRRRKSPTAIATAA